MTTTTNDVIRKPRLVQLRFRPLWLYVDKVREFCDFFAQASFEDTALGERVGMIVHELVENAIRHGDERDLEVSFEHDDGHVTICVTNTAAPQRVQEFAAMFQQQAQLAPQTAYADALKRSVTQPSDKSGLGIPRIRCEGAVELTLEVLTDGVRITAKGSA